MKIEKICCVCENVFQSSNCNQLYCSSSCREIDLTRTCKYCGEKFKVIKKSSPQIYCSKSCSVSNCNKDGLMGRNAPKNKSKNSIELICNNCGKKFERSMCQERKARKNNRKDSYCSSECYMDYIKKNTIQKYCIECNKALPLNYKSKNKNYCSEECKKVYKDRIHKVHFKCANCGKESSRNKGNTLCSENLFCSRECWREYKLNTSTKLERKNHSYQAFREKIHQSKQYKDWKNGIYKKYNNQCAICKSDLDLHVHHIISLYLIIKSCVEDIYDNENLKKVLSNELFLNINNGILLCKLHHDMCHNF